MNRFIIVIAMAALLGQAGQAQDQKEDGGYAEPFVISFVPGLSAPPGYRDAIFSVGMIGVATRDVQGFQVAGVFGLARRVEGFQATGVFGIADGDVEGFQGAGVFNIAGGRVDGFQAAGVFNIAGRVEGGQIAGVVNIADDVDGVQIGVVNIADRVDGLQIGLVNIARESGVTSTGLFCESETEYAYVVFQGGSRGLYSVFSAGLPRNEWWRSDEGLVLSYGLGARLGGHGGGSYIDVDLSAASFVGPELPAIGRALDSRRPLAEADASALIPYPSLRLCLGVPLVGKLHLVGGIKVDADLEAAPRVPEALKRGRSWSAELCGASFKAWTKCYLGVKM